MSHAARRKDQLYRQEDASSASKWRHCPRYQGGGDRKVFAKYLVINWIDWHRQMPGTRARCEPSSGLVQISQFERGLIGDKAICRLELRSHGACGDIPLCNTAIATRRADTDCIRMWPPRLCFAGKNGAELFPFFFSFLLDQLG